MTRNSLIWKGMLYIKNRVQLRFLLCLIVKSMECGFLTMGEWISFSNPIIVVKWIWIWYLYGLLNVTKTLKNPFCWNDLAREKLLFFEMSKFNPSINPSIHLFNKYDIVRCSIMYLTLSWELEIQRWIKDICWLTGTSCNWWYRYVNNYVVC